MIARTICNDLIRLFLCCAVFCCVFGLFPGYAQGQSTTEDCKVSFVGPYCGVYCVYSVAKLNDIDIDLRSLLKGEFIGSKKGSSLAELKMAAERLGLQAEVVRNLTANELKTCSYPIILHTRNSGKSRNYDHYEVFHGNRNGKAQIFDPPYRLETISYYKILSRWDGTGLIVATKPIDLGNIFAGARIRFAVLATIVIGLIILIKILTHHILPKTKHFKLSHLLVFSISQSIVFVIVSLSIGIIWHFVSNEGFLAHTNATADIREAHLSSFIPKINKKKVERMLNSDTVFVDARHAEDYDAGYLEGAVNIPVDTNNADWEKLTHDISKDASVVVYCQSAGCPYAVKTAKRLKDDGFGNVSIFKGGWNEWKAKENR